MNTETLLREAVEVKERWPMIGEHNLKLNIPLPQVRALVRLAQAAQQLRDHIDGGMESRTHLPGDLCMRRLASALDDLESL